MRRRIGLSIGITAAGSWLGGCWPRPWCVPWSRREPHPLLTEWAQRQQLAGAGKRAIVVGCGPGADTEYISSLGYQTSAFDISPTAVRLARRHRLSAVQYTTADLLDLPGTWWRAFDLVVEVITVQALPDPRRRDAATPSSTSRAWSAPAAPSWRSRPA